VASRLDSKDEDSCSTEEENPSKKPKLFNFVAEGLKKKRPRKSESEVDSYLGQEILHFDEDPLMYWKKKSEEFPTLPSLAKDYLGLTATSAPSERVFSIAGF